MRYVFAFAPFPFSIYSADILRSPLMACCFLSQIFQYGQCLRSFCAPSLGMLQEVLSSFDDSLPKQGNMRQNWTNTRLDYLTDTKRLLYLYTSLIISSSSDFEISLLCGWLCGVLCSRRCSSRSFSYCVVSSCHFLFLFCFMKYFLF